MVDKVTFVCFREGDRPPWILPCFIAQFGSARGTRRVIELAVEDILGQATIFHKMDDGRGLASADVAAS